MMLNIKEYIIFILVFTLFFIDGISNGQSLNFPSSRAGISIGNSPVFTGLRLNFRDKNLDLIKGVNFTIWKPDNKLTGDFTGLAVGIWGPGASKLSGILLGGSVQASKSISGISIGLIWIYSRSKIQGLTISGVGIRSSGDILGVVGGLGIFCAGNIKGLSASISTTAEKNISGIHIAGLIIGADKSVKGVNVAALGVGAKSNLIGFNAGFSTMADGTLIGAAVGGFSKVLEDVQGVTLNGIATLCQGDFQGINITGLYSRIGGDFMGFSVSALNHIGGQQNGITFGLFNIAKSLKGVQIGLINYVKDNPKWARILPLINARF